MALIGNQLSSAENNSYRVLDNLASFTLTFDGSSSANVLASTDTIALSQHPFVTGQRVTYSSNGGSPIGGLLSGNAYYITKTDQNSFKLASSYVNAITNINIDLVGTGTGVTHSFNVAFDGVNTKFKATYSNGTKCTISRAAQLDIAINGVVQQPYDSNPPPNGFTIEADATIVFSTAPLSGYTFWGKALSGSIASVENSDNSIDNFTGNGSTTNFTLSKTPTNSQNVLVTINGVTQYPSDATGTRSYSTNANVLVFTAPPANGSLIQVRYIGFAGPTSSNVTGFYGRTGNVVLNSSDGIGVGTAKIGTGIVGLATALLVEGNVRITGILTIGTSSITLNGSTGSTDSIVVGSSFIRNNSIGLGQTTTTGRNAGVSTAQGTLIFNSDTGSVQVYNGNAWRDVGKEAINATGGLINEYVDSTNGKIYRAHIFTSSGFFTVPSAPPSATVDYLVVAGGGGGGGGAADSVRGGGGGSGGFRTGSGIPVSTTPGSYAITVGSGGNGAPTFNVAGSNGTPSIFSTITSQGGGLGGSSDTYSGTNGGSGGGGGTGNTVPSTGGTGNRETGTSTPAPTQGNNGGNGVSYIPNNTASSGGGGGGAAQIGSNGSGGVGGNGGNGTTSSITGISTTYAGGGGGGGGTTGGSAGSGGGGAGGTAAAVGSNGVVATGGGGGGGASPNPDPGGPRRGGSGGSGIVVVRYEIGQVGGTAKATGGAISYTPTTTVHTFYSSGVFTVTNPALSSVDYLVVAGGGGGGSAKETVAAGGGGAGAVLYKASQPVSATSYSVVVGGGGIGGAKGSPAPSSTSRGSQGGSSSVFSTTAAGGGYGGTYSGFITGGPGGSGGGGAWPTGVGGPASGGSGGGTNIQSPTSGFGNAGGANPATPAQSQGGAGGGGAGSSGADRAPSGTGGAGGSGIFMSISGTAVAYGGGGGGGASNSPADTGVGGLGGGGGGGNGGSGAPGGNPGSDATIATGSGGGGGSGSAPGYTLTTGGNGGSGIVIIAYPS